MFTGIVEEMGTVRGLRRAGGVLEVGIEALLVREGTAVGDSIAVNGVCLTVTAMRDRCLFFDAVTQTLHTSNLGALRVGERVNLERSLRVGERISGHFVSGHVDCTGIIRTKRVHNRNLTFEIAVPGEFMQYVVPKGSIALDGISLTIAERRPPCLSIAVIPHTYRNTTLSFKGPSHKLNVEFDMLVKGSRV
jgi:riboflavin synthase